MSDATSRWEGSSVGKGLTSSAKPFVPTQIDGGRATPASPSSAIYAAPFVPSSSVSQSNTRHSATGRRGADGESQITDMVFASKILRHADLSTG